MKASDIYDACYAHFGNHEHIFKNKYIFPTWSESDFFCVSKSGYCMEVEVKVSVADFKADFKKIKHRFVEKLLLKQRYHVEPGHTYERFIRDINGKFTEDHLRAEATDITIHDIPTMPIPNRFYYAMPENMVHIDRIPKYAGVIYVTKDSYRIVRNAPFLHKRLLNIKELLFDKYFWQAQTHRNEIAELQNLLLRYRNYVITKGLDESGKPYPLPVK